MVLLKDIGAEEPARILAGDKSMETSGAFILVVEPATASLPAKVSIALTGAVPDQRGILHVTRNCMSLDELEGCINALQDELDVLRAEARQTFAGGSGHA
jgi:hypothetical protein